RVQVPEDDLDNLQAKSEEGTLELEDPQELLGSILLDSFLDFGFLEYTNVTTGLSVLLTIGIDEVGFESTTLSLFKLDLLVLSDSLALETKFTHVEENTGVLESKFIEGGMVTIVLSDLVTCAINIVRAASISVRLRLLMTPFCCGERATDVSWEMPTSS
nr:hypothetical protein [Tanacetum cinerariifolium]